MCFSHVNAYVSLGGVFPFSATRWTFHFERSVNMQTATHYHCAEMLPQGYLSNEPGFLFLFAKLQNQFYSMSQRVRGRFQTYYFLFFYCCICNHFTQINVDSELFSAHKLWMKLHQTHKRENCRTVLSNFSCNVIQCGSSNVGLGLWAFCLAFSCHFSVFFMLKYLFLTGARCYECLENHCFSLFFWRW